MRLLMIGNNSNGRSKLSGHSKSAIVLQHCVGTGLRDVEIVSVECTIVGITVAEAQMFGLALMPLEELVKSICDSVTLF